MESVCALYAFEESVVALQSQRSLSFAISAAISITLCPERNGIRRSSGVIS